MLLVQQSYPPSTDPKPIVVTNQTTTHIKTDLQHSLSTFMRCLPFTWFQCCTARKNHPEQISSDFGFHAFSYGELEVATEYFASSRILGKGSFGIVYHGELQDGRQIAVKFFRENKHKKVQQFMNEIEVLSKLSHQNLVPFYGYCHHGHELMIVYQYIPNGTLADHLHGKRKKHGALPWHTRLNIAIEAARALAYLHTSGIIHRDVKSANILLDKKFCVKVADFGLSRTLPLDVSTSSQGAAAFVSHASTAPQGTFGYIDPDYFQYYRVSDKSDTYSFGVVLSEIISSSKAVDTGRNPYEENLSSLTINKIQNQALHELVDPCLGFQSDNEIRHAITAVAELAFQCLQCPKELRPSMKQVLETLQGIKQGTWGFHQIT